MNTSQLVAMGVTAISLLFACRKGEDHNPHPQPKRYSEKYRPQIHFSPKANWMNDPNGLFYLDGEYHLFFQYYPDSTVWGPMHWGHAVSKDLIHWQQYPIALYPDSLGYIFSGSAVVDSRNTSGFGSENAPPVVAIYTYHDVRAQREGRIDYQSQGIAYSTDRGRTWNKFDGNPVLINPGIQDFRDPKVSWDSLHEHWVMTLAVKDHIEFYGSRDLKKWEKTGDFGMDEGAHGGVWECPDLLPFRGANGKITYVLLVSINPGAPNGGSGTQYFVGKFDGSTFRNNTPGSNTGWVDYGTDNYAGVTFSNIPPQDGRTITIGWMSNWLYAQVAPTEPWRSAMTLPRTFKLTQAGGIPVLASSPVAELSALRIDSLRYSNFLGKTDTLSDVLTLPGSQVELVIDISQDQREAGFEVILSNAINERLVVGLDGASNEFYIDRRHSGEIAFSAEFPGKHIGPRRSSTNDIRLTLILDSASIELFADNGTLAMTDVFFPTSPYTSCRIRAPEMGIEAPAITIYALESIW